MQFFGHLKKMRYNSLPIRKFGQKYIERVITTMTKTTNFTYESFPILIGIKDAGRIGITRNNFYNLAHRHNDMVVEISGRFYLRRDVLFNWIENGGDRKVKAERVS